MFLRLVTHAVRPDESEKMAETYHRTVLSALRTTKGCVFASLLQNTADRQECISMTIWDSRQHSVDYEESGLYRQLVDALRPHFVESNEYKLELSADLSLEYLPVLTEPTVERFDAADAESENIIAKKAAPFAVQILTLSVQQEKIGEFEKIFAGDIHAKYQSHKGFIDLILLRQQREYHVISFWDETVDIQSTTGLHSINELLSSIYKILPSFIQWKVAKKSSIPISASSEDIKAAVHRCLIAEWFKH
jgi:heme-degrading monooxygenase HmoA